jgi:hypothetical protein
MPECADDSPRVDPVASQPAATQPQAGAHRVLTPSKQQPPAAKGAVARNAQAEKPGAEAVIAPDAGRKNLEITIKGMASPSCSKLTAGVVGFLSKGLGLVGQARTVADLSDDELKNLIINLSGLTNAAVKEFAEREEKSRLVTLP